ncbi:MAG: Synechococcus phage [Cyanobacteriota bacterium]
MVTVLLLGQLGELFGHEWNLDIRSPIEAIRAISCQSEGFTNYINSTQQYELIVDRKGAEFDLNCQILESITIAPYIQGAGDAGGRILTGVALLGASLIFPGALLGISSATIGLFGASMILGGIVELLSDQKDGSQESFLFDASGVSRAVQGAPIPILFGERFISPIPISVAVDNENISVDFRP